MGCYQIVINGDNGRQSILLFLWWFTTLIIAQKAGKCNYIPPLFPGCSSIAPMINWKLSNYPLYSFRIFVDM